MLKKIFALSFLLIFVAPAITQLAAQVISPEYLTGNISLIVTPPTPEPGQGVNIKIEAPGVDVYNAGTNWSVNGVVVESGKGITEITLIAGAIGQRTNVSVSLTPPSGQNISKSITIAPSSVDILWQGETYAPPFFKGLPLWTRQSPITILAIPHVSVTGSTERSPSSLVYKWSRNGTVLGPSSGLGKNTLTFTDSILSQPQEIRVDILAERNALVASKVIVLAPHAPSLVVYEDSPLYGTLFNREIASRDHLLRGEEITFAAFPLFFATTSRLDPAVQYSWRASSGDAETRSSVTYRIPEGASGSSRISLSAKHRDNITQSTGESFLIQFEQ